MKSRRGVGSTLVCRTISTNHGGLDRISGNHGTLVQDGTRMLLSVQQTCLSAHRHFE